MKKNNLLLLKNIPNLGLALLIYVVFGLVLLKYYQYQINPDGVSYIGIAQKYLRGDFFNAIKGHWGPLMSWLLMPFLYLGLAPLFAAKILSLIIGFLTIIGVRLLSYKFEMDQRLRDIILFTLIPICLFFSLSVISPDLLMVCVLVFYLNIIFSNKYSCSRSAGLWCGLLGAIAYLSKNYAFPFFLVHFSVFNIIHYFRNPTSELKKRVVANFILGIVVFLIISGAWISLLSNKYGYFTVGTAGKYNFAVFGPELEDHPMHVQGFLKPADKTAVSAWEDPAYLDVGSWGPLQSWGACWYEIKYFLNNALGIIFAFQSFSVFAFLIFFGAIFLAISKIRQGLKIELHYSLITMAIYSIGFALFLIELRYLWITYILLLLMGGYLLNKLLDKEYYSKRLRSNVILGLFVVSFLVFPVDQLVRNLNTGREMYELSKKLKHEYIIKGNIASNKKWADSLYLSYYLNAQYYGESKKEIYDKELATELKKHKIDYYFVWQKGPQFLDNYEEVTDGEIDGLRIYNLKQTPGFLGEVKVL